MKTARQLTAEPVRCASRGRLYFTQRQEWWGACVRVSVASP